MRSRFPDEDQPPHSFPGHNTPVSHDTTKAGLFSCNFSLPTASKLVLDGRWSKQEELKTGSEDRMTRSPSNERGSLPKMHTERMRIASFTTVDGSVFAPDRVLAISRRLIDCCFEWLLRVLETPSLLGAIFSFSIVDRESRSRSSDSPSADVSPSLR